MLNCELNNKYNNIMWWLMHKEQLNGFISKSWNGLSLNIHLQINFLTNSTNPLKSTKKHTIAVSAIKFKYIIHFLFYSFYFFENYGVRYS